MDDLTADFAVERGDEGFRVELAMTVRGGTTAALLGPNGAGKTTVLAAIAGLVPVDAGSIRLGDTVFDDPAGGVFVPPERRGIGMVFQDGRLFAHLTAADNVAFGPRSAGVTRAEADAAARRMLATLGVPQLADRMPARLSGGEASRVALARALAADPRALLLDEPLASVDVEGRSDLRRVLREHLAGFAGPRILVTHDPVEAFLLADVIHVLEDGAITQSGTPDDIRLRPSTPYIAHLSGINLLRGDARSGVVDVGGGQVHIADPAIAGPVIVTIQPTAISLHRAAPEGSQRNTWLTTVRRREPLGSRVRVLTGGPVPLTVEVTTAADAELGLGEDTAVWVAFKATEVDVEADANGGGTER